MAVWPEERLRAQVEAAGGQLTLGADSLFAAFSVRHLTERARRNIAEWLGSAGLESRPALDALADGGEIALFLRDTSETASTGAVATPGTEDGESRPASREEEARRQPAAHPGARRWLRRLFATVGILLLLEATVTLAWQEPFTAYLAAQAQHALSRQLDVLKAHGLKLAPAEERALAAIPNYQDRLDRRLSFFARDMNVGTPPGHALGRIDIPRLGIDFVVVQGTEAASLRKGPSHYADTVLPGQRGTVGIAGHRTTYLAPFRHIDDLRAGDQIVLTMPYGRFTYQIEGHRIVDADESGAFRQVGFDRLVLSACHPLYSAAQRYLVFARLTGAEPLGPARVEVPGTGTSTAERRVRTDDHLRALGDRSLGAGMSGSDVRALQYLLGVSQTGNFGPETESALSTFQTAHGLPADGVAGPATKQVLAQRPGPPGVPPTPPDVAPAPSRPAGQSRGPVVPR